MKPYSLRYSATLKDNNSPCHECSNYNDSSKCEGCIYFNKNRETEREKNIKNIILMFVTLIVGLAIAKKYDAFSLLNIYISISLPWGWTHLGRFNPRAFLSVPFVGWFMYGFSKMVLAACFGVVILPLKVVELFKYIRVKYNLFG